jgi:hypothetical protein
MHEMTKKEKKRNLSKMQVKYTSKLIVKLKEKKTARIMNVSSEERTKNGEPNLSKRNYRVVQVVTIKKTVCKWTEK